MAKEPSVDYGQLTLNALNRHLNSPEFTARYKARLLEIPPEDLTPVQKADLERMLAEEKAAEAKND